MQPAAERLQQVLEQIKIAQLQVPVVTNVEATANADAGRVVDLLVRQVCAPVRWTESVEAMAAGGVERCVEIGPGKVLTGLIKRIVKGVETANMENCASLAGF